MPALRHKLRFGPYLAPRKRVGKHVKCIARGELVIVALSDARIPWPIGRDPAASNGLPNLSLVLCGDLVRAVRRETNAAVAYHWGVTGQTVTRWRRQLRVGRTEGDRLLRAEHGRRDKARLAAMHAKARDPVRRAKIAAAKRGKPRSTETKAKLRAAHLGRTTTKATRAKMSAAHKARGTRPPWLNPPWSAAEDRLVRTLSSAEAAKRTGRTIPAVWMRRSRLRAIGSSRRSGLLLPVVS